MVANQIPLPPIEMVMPPANAVVALVCYSLLAAFALWALREAFRTRSPLPVLVLVGGILTAVQEPILAHVGAFWYPDIGSQPVLRAFNVSVPAWAVAAYGLYVGGLTVLLHRKMAAGMTARQLWAAYFLIWLFNLGLELPGLNLGIYRYYGEPAWSIFGFPMTWAITNVAIPVLASALLIGYREVFKGPRALLVVPLMPMIGMGAEAATGFPTWMALNSAASPGTKVIAACITLGLSLLVTYLVSIKFCRQASPAARLATAPRAAPAA